VAAAVSAIVHADRIRQEANDMDQSLQQFLSNYASYRHSNQPERQAFNHTLQHFAQHVALLCNLHSNGKLSAEEFIDQIETLWSAVEQCKGRLDQAVQESGE
jgi:exonuclease VII small subunit